MLEGVLLLVRGDPALAVAADANGGAPETVSWAEYPADEQRTGSVPKRSFVGLSCRPKTRCGRCSGGRETR